MNRKQKVAFWSLFIGFCVLATIGLYPQDAFDDLSMGGAAILTASFLMCGLAIYLFVTKNPKKIEDWFSN